MSWKDITKEERKHIYPIRTTEGMADMRQAQKELDSTREVCQICHTIAVKLGIEK